MEIKKIEELDNKELRQRMYALYDPCGFGTPNISTTKERFMRRQWSRLADRLETNRIKGQMLTFLERNKDA